MESGASDHVTDAFNDSYCEVIPRFTGTCECTRPGCGLRVTKTNVGKGGGGAGLRGPLQLSRFHLAASPLSSVRFGYSRPTTAPIACAHPQAPENYKSVCHSVKQITIDGGDDLTELCSPCSRYCIHNGVGHKIRFLVGWAQQDIEVFD